MEMSTVMEHRICIKFCMKQEISATETHRMLKQAFGDEAPGKTKTFEWYKRFKDGRESYEDDPRCGRPTTSLNTVNVNKVQDVIQSDYRQSLRELSERTGISFGSCRSILTDNLSLRRISGKYVPKMLTEEQKDNRCSISKNILKQYREDGNFLTRIISGDEAWIYGGSEVTFNTVNSVQCSTEDTDEDNDNNDIDDGGGGGDSSSNGIDANESRPPEAKRIRLYARTQIKVMIIVYFDGDGLIHYEFVPKNQQINKNYYITVLKRLNEAIKLKRPKQNDLLYLHRVQTHSADVDIKLNEIQEIFDCHKIAPILHPTHSPDLTPSDFFLFPKLKMGLKGKPLHTLDELMETIKIELNKITRPNFKDSYQRWKKSYEYCIESDGDYYEVVDRW